MLELGFEVAGSDSHKLWRHCVINCETDPLLWHKWLKRDICENCIFVYDHGRVHSSNLVSICMKKKFTKASVSTEREGSVLNIYAYIDLFFA